MTDPKVITTQLKNELDNNSLVLAFILVGSQARETIYKASPSSDLEAFVVVKDGAVQKVEEELPGLLSEFGEVLFSFKHQIGFVAVYEDLFRIELPVIKQSDMAGVFSRPKSQEIKILIDKTEGELEEVLDKRPETIDYEELFKDKVRNFWYWQIIGVQYFKKGEIFNTRAILNIQASVLIKLFELLNNPKYLLLEANKRVEEFLAKNQLQLLKEITVSYDPKEIKKALRKVVDIFSVLSKEIKDKYGYDYEKSIEEKIKPKIFRLLD